MADEQKTLGTVSIVDLAPLASNTEAFSLDEFHMKPTKIAKVEVVETNKGYLDGKWVDPLPVPQKQLYIEGEPLKTVKNREGKEVVFCAREYFNLVTKKDGSFGWSLNEKANLQKFMKAVKAVHPKELLGKTAMVKVVDRVDKTTGEKTQWLRYMY